MKITAKEQPLCRWCGKPLRKASRTVHVERAANEGKTHKAASNYSRAIFTDSPPTNKAECQKLTNQQVISVSYTPLYEDGEKIGRKLSSFGEWDGESYIGLGGFFCTSDCAMELGISAARHHNLAGTDYNKAMKKRQAG